jgi:hypothetical protein
MNSQVESKHHLPIALEKIPLGLQVKKLIITTKPPSLEMLPCMCALTYWASSCLKKPILKFVS